MTDTERSGTDGMGARRADRPWEALRARLRTGSPADLIAFLDSQSGGDRARAVSRLDADDQARLLAALPPTDAAALIDTLSGTLAAELMERLPTSQAAAIVNELGSDEQADLLGTLDARDAEAILAAMDPVEAANARRLAQYDAGTAGGLMITEFLCYRDDQTVCDVLDDLRAHADRYSTYDVQYAYVVRASAAPAESAAGELVGVLRLRDMLLAAPQRRVAEMVVRQTLSVCVDATLDTLAEFFDRHQLFGVPVVDAGGQLLGVVRRLDVEEARADRADTSHLKRQGIVAGEELRTMPFTRRAGRRLVWLVSNLALNVVAISVIAYYEKTIAAVIALAVFLPLISDMGGNAGIQAIAVSIREMSLGLLKPHELMWVTLKESSVGICNGLILGVLVGVVGTCWQQNPYLGAVVGIAMVLNTIVATVIGGAMPLVLQRWGMDPALSAGPVLTTITDMTGFFFVLSIATALLARLAG